MLIDYQLYGRCFWHVDCEKDKGRGIMKIVREDQASSLVECLSCGEKGHYPVGGVSQRECREEMPADLRCEGWNTSSPDPQADRVHIQCRGCARLVPISGHDDGQIEPDGDGLKCPNRIEA